MPTLDEFASKFFFRPELAGYVGVERECFLVRDGKVAPIAHTVLSYLQSNANGRADSFGYELSGCQLEDRTYRPCLLNELCDMLKLNEAAMVAAEKALGFTRLYCGTGPEDMPLDHYPDPRYDRIVATLPREALRAACRVTGVHIHVGMSDHKTALATYNKVIKHFPRLCMVGCDSFDGRLGQYQVVVDSLGKKGIFSKRIVLFQEHLVNGITVPPPYGSWEDFYDRAVGEGFVNDPRRLWDFIRISRHGTIEFRMFDSTIDLSTIYFWAALCRTLCVT